MAALPVYRWQPSHAIFTFPNAMPDLTAMTDGPGTDSAPGNALEGTEAIGGVTTTPADGEGEIFVNDSGRTVLNSFLLCNAIDSQNLIPNDVDEDDKPDATELWENEIAYVMQGNVQPVLLPGQEAASTGAATKKNIR